MDKVAIEREQRLLAGSAERSNFNEVNSRRPDGKSVDRRLLTLDKKNKVFL